MGQARAAHLRDARTTPFRNPEQLERARDDSLSPLADCQYVLDLVAQGVIFYAFGFSTQSARKFLTVTLPGRIFPHRPILAYVFRLLTSSGREVALNQETGRMEHTFGRHDMDMNHHRFTRSIGMRHSRECFHPEKSPH